MDKQTWLMGPGKMDAGRGKKKISSLPASAMVPSNNGHSGFNPRTGKATGMKQEQGRQRIAGIYTPLPLQQVFCK